MAINQSYVRDLSKRWGRKVRANIPRKDKASIGARMIELGERAMPEQFSSSVPYAGMTGEIGEFHRIWMASPTPMKHVVYIFNVRTESPKEKAIELGMPRSEMYLYLDRFDYYYEGKTDSRTACSETLIVAV